MSEPKFIEMSNEEMAEKHMLIDTALADRILKSCDGMPIPVLVSTFTSLVAWMIEKQTNPGNMEAALHETIAYLLWYVDLPETSEGETLQ